MDFEKEIDVMLVVGKKKKKVEIARKKLFAMGSLKAYEEFQKDPDLSVDIIEKINLGGLRIYPALPPQIVDAIIPLRVGEVSDIISLYPEQYVFVKILDESKSEVS